MASKIEEFLNKILSSRYGKDVRQAIHDGIHQCYEDGKAGAVDLLARKRIDNLVANDNPTEGNSELVDIRVGANGNKYNTAGEAVRRQAADLKNDIDIIAIIRKNYLNPSNAIKGKYVEGQVGEKYRLNNNSDYYTYIMPATYGEKYVLQQTDYRWLELDEEGIILAVHGNALQNQKLEIEITDTNTKKIAFSWYSIDPSRYMVVEPNVSFDEYIPYPYSVKLTDDVLEDMLVSIPKKIYTVGGDKADFQTFTDMLKSLKGDESVKTVYVNSGTYDIFEEIGGAEYIKTLEMDNISWSDVSDIVPSNTSIIGVGDVTLKFKPSDEEIMDSDRAFLFSPLNLVGSCYIENISIDAHNCRYAIHCESNAAPAGDDAEIILKNVRCTRTTGTYGNQRQVFGSGIGKNAKWVIEDCIFISDCWEIFTVHTNAPTEIGSASIYLKNCVLKRSDGVTNEEVLRFISQYLPVDIHNFVYVDNCFISGLVATEVNISNKQSFDVSLIGGTYYGLNEDDNATSGYKVNVYGANKET